jgi:hypothetical protein
MNEKKDEFTINWLTPEKDIVKEPSELEEKVAGVVNEIIEEHKNKKKVNPWQKVFVSSMEQSIDEYKKTHAWSDLNFEKFKNLGQERAAKKVRKPHIYEEVDDQCKAKAIAEELVSANLIVNSNVLSEWIQRCVGNRNFDVVFVHVGREDCHNIIRREYGDIKIYLYSEGWNAKTGVWDIRHTAELAKEALTESGFKTGEVKNYDNRGYRFELDLTSMFKRE